jgi:Ser/Thr protein kinase RdoA (MazF antagonist)
MEEHIRKAVNDNIIKEAGKYYNLQFNDIKYYGGFENFIYVYKKSNVEYILRLVHSDHKSYDQVLAEIEFIDYLARNGASVSTVIHSVNDNIVEKIEINNKSYFTVTSFVRGKGGRVREDLEKLEFWQNLGKQIGLLHKLTKTFEPKHKRIVWEEDTLYQLAPKFLSGKEEVILEKLNERINKISSFSKNIDNYGLIHTDLHIGNMVIDESGNLTFFDFDDSAYKHFISDIAIVLFYHFAYGNPSIKIKTEKSLWILNNFFKGYKIHNNLPKEELLHLQDFLKLRELTLYTVIIAGGEETIQSKWGQNYINTYRQKIIDDTPFIDLDYIIKNLNY